MFHTRTEDLITRDKAERPWYVSGEPESWWPEGITPAGYASKSQEVTEDMAILRGIVELAKGMNFPLDSGMVAGLVAHREHLLAVYLRLGTMKYDKEKGAWL